MNTPTQTLKPSRPAPKPPISPYSALPPNHPFATSYIPQQIHNQHPESRNPSQPTQAIRNPSEGYPTPPMSPTSPPRPGYQRTYSVTPPTLSSMSSYSSDPCSPLTPRYGCFEADPSPIPAFGPLSPSESKLNGRYPSLSSPRTSTYQRNLPSTPPHSPASPSISPSTPYPVVYETGTPITHRFASSHRDQPRHSHRNPSPSAQTDQKPISSNPLSSNQTPNPFIPRHAPQAAPNLIPLPAGLSILDPRPRQNLLGDLEMIMGKRIRFGVLDRFFWGADSIADCKGERGENGINGECKGRVDSRKKQGKGKGRKLKKERDHSWEEDFGWEGLKVGGVEGFERVRKEDWCKGF